MNAHTISSAAEKFGVSLVLGKSHLRIESGDTIIESAIIDGFQNTPASSYHEGVDVAIIRYQSKELGIPDGFYKLTTKADEKIESTGKKNANSYLFDQDGNLIFSCPHTFDVNFVELPSGIDRMEAIAQVNIHKAPDSAHTFNSHLEYTIDYCCNNGTCGTCIGPACPT